MESVDFIAELLQYKSKPGIVYPDKSEAVTFIDELFSFLFELNKDEQAHSLIASRLAKIESRLAYLIAETEKSEQVIKEQTTSFFKSLQFIYRRLLEDANALLFSDPAAHDLSEVILTYPGFYATAVYRFSHQLWKQGVRLLPRVFSEYAHSKTGIDIHPAATIGRRFAIDHGTGVVIGATTTIGDDVKLYQGVTLGALQVDKTAAQLKRHPTIGDNVIIYSGATILGGKTVIGKGSIIGGNVWLTYSVPEDSVVYHKSEVRIKDKNPFPEPFNYVI